MWKWVLETIDFLFFWAVFCFHSYSNDFNAKRQVDSRKVIRTIQFAFSKQMAGISNGTPFQCVLLFAFMYFSGGVLFQTEVNFLAIFPCSTCKSDGIWNWSTKVVEHFHIVQSRDWTSSEFHTDRRFYLKSLHLTTNRANTLIYISAANCLAYSYQAHDSLLQTET